jgi:hypothetical protein
MAIVYINKCQYEIQEKRSSGMLYRYVSAYLEHWPEWYRHRFLFYLQLLRLYLTYVTLASFPIHYPQSPTQGFYIT